MALRQLPPAPSHDYKHLMSAQTEQIEAFIAEWRETGASELANTLATIIPWSKTLAEQVSAVAAVLAATPAPQHPRDTPAHSTASAQPA